MLVYTNMYKDPGVGVNAEKEAHACAYIGV